MAFQPAVNCAQIQVRGTLFGQQVMNTFYALYPDAYTQEDLDSLADDIDGWVSGAYKVLCHSAYSYTGTLVRGLTSEIDLIAENNDSAGAGTAGGSGLAANTALAVKRRSAFTGRGARGRVFLPAIPTSGLTDNVTITAAYRTAVETALNAIRGIISTDGATEVIVHRVASGVPLATAAFYTVVEYVVMNLTVDSMRRRLPGRGV